MKFSGKMFNVEFNCFEHCSSFPMTMVSITFPQLKQELAFQHLIRQFGYSFASHSVISKKCMMFDLVYMTNGIRYWAPDKFIAPNLCKLLTYLVGAAPNNKDVPFDYAKFTSEIKEVKITCFGQTKRFIAKISQPASKVSDVLNKILNEKILPVPEEKLKRSPRKAICVNECNFELKQEVSPAEAFVIKLAVESFGCTFRSIEGKIVNMYCPCGCLCPDTVMQVASKQPVIICASCNQLMTKDYIIALGGPKIDGNTLKTNVKL